MSYSSRRDLLKAGLAVSASSLFPASALAAASDQTRKSSSRQEVISKTATILLSDSDWKLGAFSFGEGESQGAYSNQFGDAGFRSVTVPGEVQLQIGLKGMDLYYQSKEATLVNEKEWWYRKQFSVPSDFAGKTTRLVFEGVDYFATVWLNGEKLGEHEGAYVPFEFEVTSRLNLNELNWLAIKVTCPWLPKGRGFLEYMKGELVEVVPNSTIKFPFPPFVPGPDWDGIPAGGDAVFPMGLFRDVKLVASGALVVEDLFVFTKSLNGDGNATLAISGKIRSYCQKDVTTFLELTIAPESFSSPAEIVSKRLLKVHPGDNSFIEEMVVKDPKLWWTWDTGEQNLYKMTAAISLSPTGGRDTREIVFGIRTIARNEDMSYWLNGKHLYLKGAWYAIGDLFESKPTRETYEKDLRLFREANLNHLVNFTVVEKPEFYELCDRLGILTFVEFPFPQFGPMEVLGIANPRHEIYAKEAFSQARQIIVLLRNHPSIVVWAPFSEVQNDRKGWMAVGLDLAQYGYPAFVDAIGKIVAKLDPGSVFHPSFCDFGEQHFWIGNLFMTGRPISNYNEHFYANAKFVSEYGTIALPAVETLKKMLTPEEMWSPQNARLPRWYNLPIDVGAYSYQTSGEYDGFAAVLDRVHQFVDRDIESVNQLVDDSQLYQAFLFKYATENFRRRKYNSVEGIRIWSYEELLPGVRYNFLDYYRTPKMGYYYLRIAQERFAVNFAYEEALESQVSGTPLQIPAWVIIDHPRNVSFALQCEIADLSGRRIWSRDFHGEIGSDASKEIGIIHWVTPEMPGIYVLRASVSEDGGPLRAKDTTFIKVTPGLFGRRMRILLIGENRYSLPIAHMVQGMGLDVDVIEQASIHQLADLRDPKELKAKYALVWLASFDSFWKFLDLEEAQGLSQAIRQGLGFVHTGGPGSFHGGLGHAALLDLTPLAEALPVILNPRNDLFLAQPALEAVETMQTRPPIRDARLAPGAPAEWDPAELNEHGVEGFNRVEVKADSEELMTISGNPLLVIGRYGEGRTAAFMGFTPEYVERRSDLDTQVVFPYLLDQEFVSDPKTRAYFALFMKILAAVIGERPATPYDEIVEARSKPLFQTLKEQPAAMLQPTKAVEATVKGKKANGTLTLSNGPGYARLVRMRVEWNAPELQVPYLVTYSDNYFDLMPAETREISIEFWLPEGADGLLQGHVIIAGSNLAPVQVPVTQRQR